MYQASTELRDQIKKRLGAGVLPPQANARTFTGPGDGQPCACCDEPIGYSSIQYDVEHISAARFAGMHRCCFLACRDIAGGLHPSVLQVGSQLVASGESAD